MQADPDSSPTAQPASCDLLVIGSGAGGLSAAVVAAKLGLKVVVVEKEAQFGGTTAWSGGWMWLPRNPLARAAGIDEDLERPLAYLRHELGAQFDEAMLRRFLEQAPHMVEFFQRDTALRFIDGNAVPDFHGNSPDAVTGGRSVCAAAFDGRRLGESAGGVVRRDLVQAAALAPVSLVPRTDGSVAHFPHLIERAKPGLIAVRADGRRFGNEANSYYDLVSDLLAATPAGASAQAWLVCDHRFIRRYGLGAVKPSPVPLGQHLRSGYLRRGASLDDLARQCGLDGAGLQATVTRYNAMAQAGRDEDFHKGETPYNRVQGDAAAGLPNPCMAPLLQAPFYAVRVVPGSLGTFAGLKTNADAQVLDAHNAPIAGLYASGNDMASVMGGRYPSGGITLGPAMTFGFIAAHHAANRPLSA